MTLDNVRFVCIEVIFNADALKYRFVASGGTLERRKKPNSFSIFKRFSSKRDRKDLDDSTIMKKKSISLEDMQTGCEFTYFLRHILPPLLLVLVICVTCLGLPGS